jgi:hypothetical protein
MVGLILGLKHRHCRIIGYVGYVYIPCSMLIFCDEINQSGINRNGNRDKVMCLGLSQV